MAESTFVVGSYAYGRVRMDSDIVLAVTGRSRWLSDDAWVAQVLGEPFRLVREPDWGELRERRFQTATGFEVGPHTPRQTGSVGGGHGPGTWDSGLSPCLPDKFGGRSLLTLPS